MLKLSGYYIDPLAFQVTDPKQYAGQIRVESEISICILVLGLQSKVVKEEGEEDSIVNSMSETDQQ